MKRILKKVLGQTYTAKLRAWFPSSVQKEAALKETQRKSQFYATFIKKDDICFDVGANMGNRIAPLLHIGAKVVAIEPQAACYRFLKRKYGKKITLVKKGLGASETIQTFHLSNDSTISSFSDEWINAVKKTQRFKEKNWDKTVSIEMTTLDKLIDQCSIPSFIKIDVEGYELEVLKGLAQPVNMICFEYTVPEQPEKAQLCIDQIARSNKNIECNYSIGEDMVWALSEWLSVKEMKDHILSEGFKNTCFGDIYVRTKQA